VAVRYPRGKGPGVTVEEEMHALPIGKAELRRKGTRIALLAFGVMLAPALEVAKEINASVVNMRFVKPLDESMVLQMADSHEYLVTVEDNVVSGGAGSAVNECLAARDKQVRILNLGLPDCLIETGSREEMLAQAGLDRVGILQAIDERFGAYVPVSRTAERA
jgi:1-deoxy-D-xylulose-5-phosphate synthase